MTEEKKAEIILRTVADFFDISVTEIKSHCRLRKYVMPRQFAAVFMQQKTQLSQTQIGNLMGGFNHATMNHAKIAIDALVNFNGYKSDFDTINERIDHAIEHARLLEIVNMKRNTNTLKKETVKIAEVIKNLNKKDHEPARIILEKKLEQMNEVIRKYEELTR